MSLSPSGTPIRVAALYRFTRIDDPVGLRGALTAICRRDGVRGTLLVASEGVNGTVAAAGDGIDALLAFLDAHPALGGLNIRFSGAGEMPFRRMKVLLKREIVTMGVEDVDPMLSAGTYVEPEDWNALICDPDTIVVDTRNGYETALGTFRGAVDPGTASFREFPGWARRNREALKGRKVAMFCTGGIRCEKATAFVKSLGIEQVFHLKGGVLSYLESVVPEESLWDGECFVFDERVALTYGLEEGEAELCRACRRPLTAAERASPLYREGVSCLHCHAEKSEADRARYAERQRQVGIAEQRALPPHIGGRQP